jgi:hypothetical protein
MSREGDFERIFFQAVYSADERLRRGEYPGGETTNLYDEAMKFAGDRYTAMKATFDDRDQLRISCASLRARVEVLEKGLMAVDGLISESRGVDGLHLNGDVALWEDLRTGGVYEEWLRDYDAALDALKEG